MGRCCLLLRHLAHEHSRRACSATALWNVCAMHLDHLTTREINAIAVELAETLNQFRLALAVKLAQRCDRADHRSQDRFEVGQIERAAYTFRMECAVAKGLNEVT